MNKDIIRECQKMTIAKIFVKKAKNGVREALPHSASCPAVALHGHINEVVQEQVAFDVE